MANLSSKLEKHELALSHARSSRKKDELEKEINATQELLKEEIVQVAFRNKIISDVGGEEKPVELDDNWGNESVAVNLFKTQTGCKEK